MGRRILAFVIDVVLVMAVAAAAAIALATRIDDVRPRTCAQLEAADGGLECLDLGETVFVLDGSDRTWLTLAAAGVALFNAVLLQGASGGTIGKLATALRVVDIHGNVCGFGRAFLRWLFLIVDASICFLIGLITALVSRGHQRFGDMAAKTYVIDARDVGAPPMPLHALEGVGERVERE
jgi:uncharacterized RDD family membrane protein YckC